VGVLFDKPAGIITQRVFFCTDDEKCIAVVKEKFKWPGE
jgi:hypothetical protein